MSYKAFISYSHSDVGQVADIIQKGIENIGKPFYKPTRNYEVFRDDTNLSANPELWKSIEDALQASENLILLASPQASTSKWIHKEVEWWINNKSIKNIIIVLIKGSIKWSDKDNFFDIKITNCLPTVLIDAFKTEPLWIDFSIYQFDSKNALKEISFRSQIVKIISGITGKSPRDIDSNELKRQKNIKLSFIVGISILSFLIFISIFFFLSQRNAKILALKQTRIAKSNLLIAQGNLVSEQDIDSTFSCYLKGFYLNPDSTNFTILKTFYDNHTADTSNSEESKWYSNGIINHFFKTLFDGFLPDSENIGESLVRSNLGRSGEKFFKFSLIRKRFIYIDSNSVNIINFNGQQNKIILNQLNIKQEEYNDALQKIILISNNDDIDNPNNGIYQLDMNPMKLSKLYNYSENKFKMDNHFLQYSFDKKIFLLDLFEMNDCVSYYENDLNLCIFYSRNQFRIIKNKKELAFIYFTNGSVLIKELEIPDDFVYLRVLSVSPDEKFIIVNVSYGGSQNYNETRLYNLKSKKFIKALHKGTTTKVTSENEPTVFKWINNKDYSNLPTEFINPNVYDLIFGSYNGNVYAKIFQNDERELVFLGESSSEVITSLACTKKYIFAGTYNGNLLVWENILYNIHSNADFRHGWQCLASVKISERPLIDLQVYQNQMAIMDDWGKIKVTKLFEHINLSRDTTILKKQFEDIYTYSQ